ncbi:MAG: glycerophosphodiester phosphodiesterase [Fimbriimonadaceae bacterium]|nr:glycerophosphodiester phosphodiesterase [Fimbriimonadaceae bacterium]
MTFLAKPTASEIVLGSWERPMVIGHRGATGLAPENTLASFDAGIHAGAVAVDCDVHMSRDGVPFVIHDATVNRTTNGDGRVDEMSANDLSALGIPTLGQVLDHVRDRTNLVIEIKDGKGVAEAVVAEVKKRDARSRVIIFSFKSELIDEVERLDPSLYTVWLSNVAYGEASLPSLGQHLSRINADAVGFQHLNVHPALVDYLRAAGYPLFAWTVPPGNEVTRLKNLGVNFLITDFPDQIRKQVDAPEQVALDPEPPTDSAQYSGLEWIFPLLR